MLLKGVTLFHLKASSSTLLELMNMAHHRSYTRVLCMHNNSLYFCSKIREMYYKEFEIRWSDIDANRHLANTAYVNFMSHTIMSFLMENGLNQGELAKNNLGPVVFYEHFYYFKEVFAGKPVKVTLELKGLSQDGMFFEFVHNMYNHKGQHVASCEMMGAWIDLKTRKLTSVSEDLVKPMQVLQRTEDFKVLIKEDTRKFGKKPQDIDFNTL